MSKEKKLGKGRKARRRSGLRGAIQTALFLLRTQRGNKKWIFLLALNFILVFMLTGQVVDTATKREMAIQVWEPFIWVFGDSASILWVSVLLLFLLSDLPCLHPVTPFLLIRITRGSWLAGQLIYTAILTLLYMLFTLLSTVLLCFRYSYLANLWSRLALLLSQNQSQDVLPVSKRTMEMTTPAACAAQIFLLVLLYALCLGLLVLAGNLSGRKGGGVVLGILFSAFGYLLSPSTIATVLKLKEADKYRANQILGWISPLNHATYPRHSFGYDLLPTLGQSCLVFGGLLIFLSLWSLRRMRRYAFSFRGMEEP